MSQPLADDTSNGRGARRQDDTRPAPVGAAAPRARPGTLDLSIHRHGAVIELDVSGELDMATAPRLAEAMAWLRFSGCPATTIVINTRDLDFIAGAGYRALLAALVGRDGLWDPRVVLVVGPAVARLEAAIAAASAPRARRRAGGAAAAGR
jgi:anti-anti-sigma factor